MFLHTGWRSSGTWLWNQARGQPGTWALYEPLHEGLASLRARDIGRIGPGSWRSNHAAGAPYFEEYRSLVRPGGAGVAGYQPGFAFDSYFLEPDDRADTLEAYLRRLLDMPADDAVPVLKFCRSLGRVAWMERRFPEALHAVVLRDPASQWASAQRLLRERNRYFVVAPLLVLARNADRLDVRQACAALDVRLPALFSDDLAYGMETAWRHYRRQTAGERYRSFLAFWTLATARALAGTAMVIDTALMAASPVHRTEVEAAFAAHFRKPVALAPCQPACAADLPADAVSAHRLAGRLAALLGAALPPARLEFLLGRLMRSGETVGASAPGWPSPASAVLTAGSVPAGRLSVAAAVGWARALQPLRQLHGVASAWWRQ